MTATTYVCLDTNILFRVVTQGQKGYELHYWQELVELAQQSQIALLVPEIVTLEFHKLTAQLDDSMRSKIVEIEIALAKHFEAKIETKEHWNELEDVVPVLKSKLAEWKIEKLRQVNERFKQVSEFLSGRFATSLPFDQEVWFQTHRRFISGKFPRKSDKDALPWNDCSLIETLVRFFKNKPEAAQLAFCTDNLKDFGVEVKEQNALHPLLKNGLPKTELFTTLEALIPFVREHRVVAEPSLQELRDAVERKEEEERRSSIDEYLLALQAKSAEQIKSRRAEYAALVKRIEEINPLLAEYVAGYGTQMEGFTSPFAENGALQAKSAEQVKSRIVEYAAQARWVEQIMATLAKYIDDYARQMEHIKSPLTDLAESEHLTSKKKGDEVKEQDSP